MGHIWWCHGFLPAAPVSRWYLIWSPAGFDFRCFTIVFPSSFSTFGAHMNGQGGRKCWESQRGIPQKSAVWEKWVRLYKYMVFSDFITFFQGMPGGTSLHSCVTWFWRAGLAYPSTACLFIRSSIVFVVKLSLYWKSVRFVEPSCETRRSKNAHKVESWLVTTLRNWTFTGAQRKIGTSAGESWLWSKCCEKGITAGRWPEFTLVVFVIKSPVHVRIPIRVVWGSCGALKTLTLSGESFDRTVTRSHDPRKTVFPHIFLHEAPHFIMKPVESAYSNIKISSNDCHCLIYLLM